MNTATVNSTNLAPASQVPGTLTLNEGYFATRNWFDWLFAALLGGGAFFVLSRYADAMDGYEKGILIGLTPCAIALGWF